ncbi:hypothetical protein C5167_023064 [Papaver somniferum]|uniref:Uncharacterized protein n=1 Tax=Papaver somniferum TaxID=3469 RepID=A0A4Y7JNQ9_PAPSO|nr:hypothetical protein C5167_023064 [Papaver somniferum]
MKEIKWDSLMEGKLGFLIKWIANKFSTILVQDELWRNPNIHSSLSYSFPSPNLQTTSTNQDQGVPAFGFSQLTVSSKVISNKLYIQYEAGIKVFWQWNECIEKMNKMTTFNILLPWREAGGTTSLSSVLKRRLSFELESLAISADANERLSKYLSEVSRVAALRSQKKDTPQGVLFTNTKLEGSLCKYPKRKRLGNACLVD